MSLAPGARVGSYEVLGAIGAGGMGEVYRAHDTKLNRDVALKVLPEAFLHDPERLARFKREAQVLASLNQPHIAQVYGVEESTAGPAIVMELVEGPTLAELIAGKAPSGSEARQVVGVGPHNKLRNDGGLHLDDTLTIARQIVDALEAAHALGIIHRDLKPANIKVRPDGAVKVLDFGLAKAIGTESASAAAGGTTARDLAASPTMTSPAMTELGMILGTAAYMSPEQAKGRPVDKRSDIWAFGCVLYEMVTGRRAFEGDDVSDTLASILKSEPNWAALPADTPAALRRLLRRCLSKDLGGRLSDIGVARLEIAEALAPPDEGDRLAAGAHAAPSPRPRSSRWQIVSLGVAAAGLVAVSPFVVTHLREVPVVPATARFSVAPPPGTFFPTTGARATVSPDGRLIGFRAQRPGQAARLFVRAVDALDAREIAGTEGVNVLLWSPDSRSIAFFANRRLMRVDASGGPVQTLCELRAPPVGGSWSHNGTILFGSPEGLLRVPATGGQPVAVTTLDSSKKETFHTSPEFLPDGRRFLFTALPGNVVYVGSLDEPGRTQLLAGDSQASYAPPGYLLFARQGTLMAQAFDLSRAALSGDPVPIAEEVRLAGNGLLAFFSVSGTGVLAYESGQQGFSGGTPVWVDRGGREAGAVASGIDDAQFPRLSPDGRRLAVTRGGDVWVQDLQGRPPIKLTFDGGQFERFSPLWSPDGQRLVYEIAPGHLQSLSADLSNSTPTPASPEGHFHPHGWSPDGRELLAVRLGGSGANDIVAFPLGEKSEPRAVVATPANEGQSGAALSPDGRWLAYSANPTGRTEIWVRPYPGPGAPVRVSPNGGAQPVWARTGRELFYLEDRKLMAVAIQSGSDFGSAAPALLFEGAYMNTGQPPTYDVAPDGRFLMLKAPGGAEAAAAPIAVVLNWVDELRRRTEAP